MLDSHYQVMILASVREDSLSDKKPKATARPNPRLHRLALLLACATVVLLVAGALGIEEGSARLCDVRQGAWSAVLPAHDN